MPLDLFHPAVAAWFADRFGAPTEPQARAWPSIRAGRHTLIAAPTGSGKTLAAFLAAIDDLVRLSLGGELPDAVQVVYVSPLKALSNDVEKNLEEPLAGIRRELAARGLPDAPIRTLVRTGDTPAALRAAMVKRPPHILVTTPESLYILLTSEGGRRTLSTARTVIVDEIHAVADDKRGSHLALSLERLEALVAPAGNRLVRIGLSATQRPIEEVARFLVGTGGLEGPAGEAGPPCEIVDVGHRRALDLGVEVPRSPLEAVMSAEVWSEVYDRLAELIREHRTTLVFVNTRRLAERATRHLADRLGEDRVAAHHGSLAKEKRLEVEGRLRSGNLQALVATASLELGIDIGAVDLVCQLGSTRSIATLLQRVGRSGHHLGGLPKGRIFPQTRDELVECAALVDAARRGELDRLEIPERPLDILAQQIVATVASATAAEEWREDDLYRMVRRAHPYRGLAREDFDGVVEMLADGFATRRGRRAAYLHHDAVNGRLRARRGARLAAITSGGAIPDAADFNVVLEPSGAIVGTLNEDFAVESLAGDVFQLGNTSWRILKVEPGRVLVEDARGQPPSIPFWLGEAPARSAELSVAVSRLRGDLAARLESGADRAGGLAAARRYLVDDIGLPPEAALQIADYFGAAHAALGVLPTQETLVAERFFDEAGDMHLVLHSPFGGRVNRAWGLALRKRFCRTFNFELQAAASEDAIVLSLGPTHSFPLEDVFRFLHSSSARDVLVQALLDAPMFPIRWRWNASRALALLRFRGGRRVPPRLQRQEAEDLVAVVFPDQLACLENIAGEREIPDHPLIEQTLDDCLTEAMDIEGLERLLGRIERGEVTLVARDLTEPSPLAHEILNAPVYTFLDDAPLEERRTQAVVARRWLDAETAGDLGALDLAAIERMREEAWPEAASADELHDALQTLGFLTAEEGERGGWRPYLDQLAAERRAAVLTVRSVAPADSADPSPVAPCAARLWVAAERLPQLAAVYAAAGDERVSLDPPIAAPPRLAAQEWTAEKALVELVRGRLQALGPVTAAALAASLGLPERPIDGALLALESEGFVLRGRFTPGLAARDQIKAKLASPSNGVGAELASAPEWCERRLLARIHRATIDRLRREIDPVPQADFLRFLFAWQRVDPEARGTGPESVAAAVAQLEGFEAPAAAWEGEILPARVADYDPSWLDTLCLSGRTVWGRVSPPPSVGEGRRLGPRSGPIKSTPIALLGRASLGVWRELAPPPAALDLSSGARAVYDCLRARGASFFGEVAEGAGLLHTQTEEALSELVAWGLATADSFTGLRALLVPSNKRPPIDRVGAPGRRRAGVALFGMENAGRWSALRTAEAPAPLPAVAPAVAGRARPVPPDSRPEIGNETVEAVAWTLLHRYGVVFRRLLDREGLLPPWRDLLRVFRRLEARGEIRGGRFVSGFSGEQYALAEAVGRLRAIRREPRRGTLVAVSAADPLNLVGIATPGERVAALAGNRVLYRDGIPIALYEAKQVRFLIDLDAAARWQAEGALKRRSVPPQLKAYLGKSA
jgi:ATP-dependent Lhr-like helicase